MAIPSMLNLMVVPIVNAVDTYYVGQLADLRRFLVKKKDVVTTATDDSVIQSK
jgi:Na+-driven multidrug efflux pump